MDVFLSQAELSPDARGSSGLLSGLLEPGDISALLQVPNALVVILLGDKVAIGLQGDLLFLSV